MFRFPVQLSAAIIMSLAVVACGGGGGGGDDESDNSSDTTAPTVTVVSPLDSATDIAIDSVITATFSEAMNAGSVSASSFTLDNGVTGTVAYADLTATFTPSADLDFSTTYTATITTAVTDLAGNALGANQQWSFTTAAEPDSTPPTVTAVSPLDTATDIAIDSTITATFSEAMNAGSVTASSFTLDNGATGTVTYNGLIATFTPSADLDFSTTYTATITTAVTDLAGNALVAQQQWSFTTIDPVPRFAYVVNEFDDTVSQYVVNATTGQLSHNGYVLSGDSPRSITVDPASEYAYVTNGIDATISTYSIDAGTGNLTEVGTPVATGGLTPVAFAIDPSGRFAYAANNGTDDVSVFTIDDTTGVLTVVGTPIAAQTEPSSITIDPSGQFVYVANQGSLPSTISVYSINESTGTLTAVGTPTTTGQQPASIAIDPSGRFAYTANQQSDSVGVFDIDDTTGELSIVELQTLAPADGPTSIAIEPSGRFAYVTNTNTQDLSTFSIDDSTGELTAVGSPIAAGSDPQYVTVDPSGQFVYVADQFFDNVLSYSINATTGALTPVANSSVVVTARDAPVGIAFTRGATEVSRTPRFAYVANNQSDNISTFTIDASTGALTEVGTAVATGEEPYSVSVGPSGGYAYVSNRVDDTISTFSINATSGALTEVGSAVSSGNTPQGITIDPSGRFAFVVENSASALDAFTIDASTGALTALDVNTGSPGPTSLALVASALPESVTIDPAGRFGYTANSNTDNISVFSIDATARTLALVGSAVAAGDDPRSVAVHPSGRFAYVANRNSDNVSVYTITSRTGVLSAGTPVAAGDGPVSVAVDPSGRFAYVANGLDNNVSTYTIDASTGALSAVVAQWPQGRHPFRCLLILPAALFTWQIPAPATFRPTASMIRPEP